MSEKSIDVFVEPFWKEIPRSQLWDHVYRPGSSRLHRPNGDQSDPGDVRAFSADVSRFRRTDLCRRNPDRSFAEEGEVNNAKLQAGPTFVISNIPGWARLFILSPDLRPMFLQVIWKQLSS